MSPLDVAALLLAFAGAGLSILVVVIYFRNHTVIASRFTAALLLFATLTLAHALVLILSVWIMIPRIEGTLAYLVLAETGLHTGALATLAWAILR